MNPSPFYDDLRKGIERELHAADAKLEATEKAALPSLHEARRAMREAAASGYSAREFETIRRALDQLIGDVETNLVRPPRT